MEQNVDRHRGDGGEEAKKAGTLGKNVMGDYAGLNQKSVWRINKGILNHRSSLCSINKFKQHLSCTVAAVLCV